MRIIIGSDHRGYELKEIIKKAYKNISWDDVGTDSAEVRVDYPVFAKKACKRIGSVDDRAILICGSGIGVSIAANRFSKVYAGLCWTEEVARQAREHDNINVLALPADFVSGDQAIKIVKIWLETEFLGGKYQQRLDMIEGFSVFKRKVKTKL